VLKNVLTSNTVHAESDVVLSNKHTRTCTHARTHTHTHTHLFNGPFQGLPRWVGTRKVKPVWILLKQETVSGSGISWAIYKSAPRFRQITTPAPHHSVFYRPDALPATQPTGSKHWRHLVVSNWHVKNELVSSSTRRTPSDGRCLMLR